MMTSPVSGVVRWSVGGHQYTIYLIDRSCEKDSGIVEIHPRRVHNDVDNDGNQSSGDSSG